MRPVVPRAEAAPTRSALQVRACARAARGAQGVPAAATGTGLCGAAFGAAKGPLAAPAARQGGAVPAKTLPAAPAGHPLVLHAEHSLACATAGEQIAPCAFDAQALRGARLTLLHVIHAPTTAAGAAAVARVPEALARVLLANPLAAAAALPGDAEAPAEAAPATAAPAAAQARAAGERAAAGQSDGGGNEAAKGHAAQGLLAKKKVLVPLKVRGAHGKVAPGYRASHRRGGHAAARGGGDRASHSAGQGRAGQGREGGAGAKGTKNKKSV